MERLDVIGIGELAERTRSSVRSIRYYEQQGLITSVRTAAGHRRFDRASVETVLRIRRLLDAGLPLAIVAKILPCFIGDGVRLDACVADYLREHLESIDERIETLDHQRETVEGLRRLVTV